MHYSWPCGHIEHLGHVPCHEQLRLTPEQQRDPQRAHIISTLNLGHPDYPCPRCASSIEAVMSRLEAASARVENILRQATLDLEAAQQARAQRVQERQERMANLAEARLAAFDNRLSFEDALQNIRRLQEPIANPAQTRPFTFDNGLSFEDALQNLRRRDDEATRQGLPVLQEHVIRRAEDRQSPQPAPAAPQINGVASPPAAVTLIPAVAPFVPREVRPMTNGIIHPRNGRGQLPQNQQRPYAVQWPQSTSNE